MFNSVSGTITAKHPSAIYLENNGIEWDFQVSSAALDRLASGEQLGKVVLHHGAA